MGFISIIVLLFSFGIQLHAQDDCSIWFKTAGGDPTRSDCELKCGVFATDMGTFMCPSRCKEFCHPINKCSPDSFWKAALDGKPDPFKNLVGAERSAVEEALSTLPKSFEPHSLKAIVRASQPADITALTSPATSSNEFIILFPRAFSGAIPLSRVLSHETVHFLEVNEWRSQFDQYKKDTGWNTESPRSGEFVEADGKFSADEDFANNIEYFLFDPDKLKAVSPKIYNWIKKNLGARLTPQKGCKNDK